MRKLNRKHFKTLVSVYSIFALSVCLLHLYFNITGEQKIMESIDRTNENISRKIEDTNLNMTELEKMEYRNHVFEKLIDWGLQRQITWGIIFLTSLSLFFPLLFAVYSLKESMNAPPDKICLQSRFLNWIKMNTDAFLLVVLSMFFLIVGIISIFQMAHYYRYVAHFEENLDAIIAFPTGWLYYPVTKLYIIECGMTSLFFIFFMLAMIFSLRNRLSRNQQQSKSTSSKISSLS